MRTFIFILLSIPVVARQFPEKELLAKIEAATVYLNGAQVQRRGEVQIPKGETVFILKGLTPHLNDQSIQVKAEGAFTLLSVNHRINYLQDLIGKDAKVDSLRQLIEEIDQSLALEASKQNIIKEKTSLLNANKKLAGDNMSVTITQLQQVVKYYASEMTAMAEQNIASQKQVKSLNEEKAKIQRQLNEWNSKAKTPSGEIAIRVRAATATKGRFNISYVVRNAGWVPQYDIRVKDIQSPVQLRYKAEVYQNTGVDWENVKLTFSNGNPNQNGTAPQLSTWYLDFYQEYQAAKRSRVMSAAPGMSEVSDEMAAGFGMEAEEEEFFAEAELVTATVSENTTTVEFEVGIPYTVQSNGDRFSVDLNQYDLEAAYQYYAIPKLDRDAFLIARIVNWNQLNLLSGQANLYFEEAYVGRSYLNANNVSDTLNLSLGRDRSIVVTRKKVDQYSKKRTIGSNVTESRGFEISVRNTKSQPISITVFDQVPVSTNSEIEVEIVERSNGQLDKQKGEVSWDLDLAPREAKEMLLQYEVKYPKKRKINLD